MVTLTVGAAAPGGYVRAVFSRKAGGFAAPLDLMRAQIGAAGRLARRRRLRAAFGDYLVSDGCEDDAQLRRLEMYSKKYDAKYSEVQRGLVRDFGGADPWNVFSAERWKFAPGNDELCMTGGGVSADWRFSDAAGGPIDAPVLVPAGSCTSVLPYWCPGDPAPQIVVRREIVPAFTERRERHKKTAAAFSFGMSGRFGALDRTGLREGWLLEALDAPVFLPAGSMRWHESCGGYAANSLSMRARWLA